MKATRCYLIGKRANVEGAFEGDKFEIPANLVQSPSPKKKWLGRATSKAQPKVEAEAFKADCEERARPLMLAAKCGNHKIVKSLLAKQANAYAQDINKWTALHYAAVEGHTDCIHNLLQNPRNKQLVNAVNVDGDTPFNLAAINGKDLALVSLYYEGSRRNDAGQKQRTALGWAAHNAHTKCVEYLLEIQADISIPDEDGKTPLQLANELFANGKRDGMSAAKMEEYSEIIDMLEQHQSWKERSC